jgi:hypothetical protein
MKQAIIEMRICLGTFFVKLRTAIFGVVRMMTSFDGLLVVAAGQDTAIQPSRPY